MTYAIVAIAVLILDQAVKYWTNTTLAVGEVNSFIPGFIEITHHQNTGAAWGLLNDWPGARWLFVALVLVFCVVVIVMLSKNVVKEPLGRWMLVLVMAGGLGNGIDRAINGYVVDMFHFTFKIFGRDFPIFNVADIFISVCGVILCVWLIWQIFQKPEKAEEPTPPRRRSSRANAERDEPASGGDYISQLKKPVVHARVELEQQRVSAIPPRERPLASSFDDPFAEFTAEVKSQPDTRTFKSAPAVSEPVVSAPKPAEKAPAAVPKKSDTDFSLDDIMAEFSDK